jgi:hypothetical protein
VIDRSAALRDLALQQLRVLSLIHQVSAAPGNASKLDSLTKLAKLDFLVRYADARPSVRAALDGEPLPPEVALRSAIPMIRHKYGPWDDIYYPVIGALVGRGLARYVKSRNRGVGLALTKEGNELFAKLNQNSEWSSTIEEISQVAAEFGRYSGNKLKDAIYSSVPAALDVAHKSVLNA